MAPLYELDSVRQIYLDRVVLDIPAMQIAEGVLYALTGANGAGKSTLLRLLALLETPAEGTLRFKGGIIPTSRQGLIALRRQVVLVEQYPVMFSSTVAKNIEFGLKIRKIPKKIRQETVERALERVNLSQYRHHPAQALSGGESQRLALARAFAIQPDVLLCDEPTANVDEHNQHIILRALKEMNRVHGITIIFTTHIHDQAMALGQRHMRLDRGCLLTA
jgi:tungstate transport system ATP-binding protein